MTTNSGLFESTTDFVDDLPEPEALTPEQEFEKSFDEEVAVNEVSNPIVQEQAQQEAANNKRIYETMSDEELEEVFAKARLVDDLDKRIKQNHDATFGRIGSLEQQLKQFGNQAPQPVEINREKLTNLVAYLGEDDDGLLDALAKDLSALQIGIPLTPNFELDVKLAQEEQLIDEKTSKVEQGLLELRREMQVNLLTMQHPDWQDYNTVPEKTKAFVDWQLTLKEEDRNALDQASRNYDAATLSSALTKFKSWQEKKADQEANKNQRLQDGLIPTSGGMSSRPNFTNDNDYEAAFRRATGSG